MSLTTYRHPHDDLTPPSASNSHVFKFRPAQVDCLFSCKLIMKSKKTLFTKLTLIGFIVLLFSAGNISAQKQWYHRSTTLFTYIRSVSVVDSLYIYVVDQNALHKTTDGGATWQLLRYNGSDYPIVRFWNRKDGTLVILGKILATSDGGTTWRVVFNDYFNQGFCFTDSLNGITFSTGSDFSNYTLYFGKTSNGGHSWSWRSTPQHGVIDHVDQVDSIIVCVGGILILASPAPMVGTLVMHSTNNGTTWITDSTNDSPVNWTGMVLMRPKTMVAVSGYRVTKVSTTGGGNAIHYIQPRRIYSPRKSGDTAIYAGSDSGYIAYSEDFGVTFNYTKLNTNASIKWLEFTKDGDGYAFAEDGKFYSTVKLKYAPVDIEESSLTTPESFSLSQNYPNPFNPETVIRFSLPEAGFVKGVVYDILGREVATLLKSDLAAGNQQVKFDAAGLASGVYIFRLEAGKYSSAIKMVVGK
ncbi:hypothetical protein MASR1M107_30160 [Ignavibacteriales bacterium]